MSSASPETKLDPPEIPRVLKEPPIRGKVLVLSPHADDETIGLGGTIRLHADLGDEVHVLYLTKGITGNADGRYDEEAYVKIRRAEGEAACRILGVSKIDCWEYPDNYQVTEKDMEVLVPRLKAFIEEGAFVGVYTPHRGEIHTDHHVSAVLALRAADLLAEPPSFFGYEVWAPLTADFVVDISGVFSKKLQAAACYKSQLALNDINRLFECLNGYRANVLDNKAGYGEALMKMGRGS